MKFFCFLLFAFAVTVSAQTPSTVPLTKADSQYIKELFHQRQTLIDQQKEVDNKIEIAQNEIRKKYLKNKESKVWSYGFGYTIDFRYIVAKYPMFFEVPVE